MSNIGDYKKLLKRRFKDEYTDKAVHDEVILAKMSLIQNNPFWGVIASSLIMVELDDEICSTMMTDGRHIFYGLEFTRKLSPQHLKFIIAHEIFHCMMDHAGARTKARGNWKNKNETAWAWAVDFVTNGEIAQSEIGELPTEEALGFPILHDPKFYGMSSEAVYYELLNDPDSNYRCLDRHINVISVPNGEYDPDAEDNIEVDEDGNISIKMPQSDVDRIEDNMSSVIRQGAMVQADHDKKTGGAGYLPANIQRMVDELMDPKVDWRNVVRNFISKIMANGYSYVKPNKALFNHATLPGFRKNDHVLEMVVMVDTSGSISNDELVAFLTEMKGILKAFPFYRITAWCFDGDVIKDSVMVLDNTRGKSDITNLKHFTSKVAGGGGTNFMANWDYMKENKIRPKGILMLTDGFPFGEWGINGYAPTVFLVTNDGPTSPFGRTIHYEV